jgi:peptidoglycan/LPS O-acetylase OafA/YrhL
MIGGGKVISRGHHLGYRADVDGLRAIAVLLVVCFHAFPRKVPGGFVGVDIFFAISGFLIGGIIMQAAEQGSFTFGWFYARRVRRIFPALGLVLVSTLVAGWFLLLADQYAQLGKHVLGGTAFASNLVLWKEAGYFDTAAESKLLLHLWSLGVEEQFYIVWPPVLLLAYRLRWNIAVVVAVIALASFALNVARVVAHPIDTFYLPFARFWELLVGNLLAYVTLAGSSDSAPETGRRRFAANAMSSVGLGLVGLATFALDKDSTFPGWWAVVPVLAAVLLVGAGPGAWINRHVLSSRPMVWIGLVSYPLYLWHWPLLTFARIVHAGEPERSTRVAAVLLSLLLAWATYSLVERPIRTGGRMRAKTAGLCAALTAIGALGAAVLFDAGVPSRRVSQLNARIERNLEWEYWSDAGCLARFKETPCELNAEQPEIMLLGDSHANSLFPGLTQIDRPLRVVGVGACGPFEAVEQVVSRNADKHMCTGKDYVAVNERILDTVPSIRVVVLSAFWRPYITGEVANDREREEWGSLNLIAKRPEEKELSRFDLVVNGLARTVAYAESLGKTVVFVRDVPDLAEELRTYCKLDRDCSIPRAEVDAKQTLENELLKRLLKRHPDVRVFDPLPELCDADACYLMKDGHLLYRDHHHLSLDGSLRVGTALAEFIRQSSAAPLH